MTRLRLALCTAAMMSGTALLAGPVADYEGSYRAMYADYRAALFATNAGKQPDADRALAALEGKWDALAGTYGDAPPPHFADDPFWADTLAAVDGLIATAAAQVAAGDLPAAHETLEGVRDSFGALHRRNGIETFSDRMNAYHAEMEHVLATDLTEIDDLTRRTLHERAAVMAWLAADLLAHPPAEGVGNAAFTERAVPFAISVGAFLVAARGTDDAALREAVAGLRAPYARLFLDFG